MSDSSYGVEAAALTALIREDTAHRAQWIAQGLVTKSYRDVIQSATLNMIARVGDASYTAVVDSLRGANALRGEHAGGARRARRQLGAGGARALARRHAPIRARVVDGRAQATAR